MKKQILLIIGLCLTLVLQAQTAADYYLPLCVGNYTKLHTTSTSSGYCDRSTIYSFIKTENINGVTYFVEEGWEGEYPTGECTDVKSPVFRYFWLRKDDNGNIMLGAAAEKNNNNIISLSLDSATILSAPMAIFPNSFLIAGSYISYPLSDTELDVDTVVSISATVGSYTNCIQVRSIQRNTVTGVVNSISNSYYAYHVGLVRTNRTFCLNDGLYDSYIVDYVANTPPIPINITAGGLSAALTSTEKNTITNLALTGTIDARDFKTMRDSMPALTTVDLSGTNIAEYTGTEGTYSTEVTDYPANSTPRLGLYNKKSLTSVVLPTTITALGRSSFNSCSNLTSINIPSSVTSIGYAEFNFCSSLTSVNIPSGITFIDTYTFGNCTSLKSITIPSTVTSIRNVAFCNSGLTTITLSSGLDSIGQWTFQNCSYLNSVTLPSTVTSIGDGAFNSSGLTAITLPTGLKSIGQWAFNGCSALNTVTIPSTVSTIGYSAFTYDNALISLQVASDNLNFSSLDGVLYDKTQKRLLCFPAGKSENFIIPPTITVIDTAAFEGNWKLRSVTIPSTVTKLSQEAFNSCYLLAETNIPASITSIGGASFYNCTNLASIFINTASPLSINTGDSIFNYVNKSGCVLYVPLGAKAAYQSAPGWNEFNRIIEFVPTTDYDNNVYHGITIGTQTWLVENLKTTHYQNGDFIGTTSTPTLDISSQTAPEYQWMPNGGDDTKVPIYGRLYTWYAATDSRNVCPENYRIPSQTDWNTLINYLINNGYGYGGSGSGIGKSIAAASIEWASDSIVGSIGFDIASNNRSGFLAFPASVRQATGTVYNTGGGSWWWSSTQKTDGSVLNYYINYNMTDLTAYLNYNNNAGFSIRCMKDAQTSVNQLSDTRIELYPNPATDGFYINTGTNSTPISIYDLNGTLILTKQVSDKEFVNISTFKQGVYIIKIQTERGKIVKKLVKK